MHEKNASWLFLLFMETLASKFLIIATILTENVHIWGT